MSFLYAAHAFSMQAAFFSLIGIDGQNQMN